MTTKRTVKKATPKAAKKAAKKQPKEPSTASPLPRHKTVAQGKDDKPISTPRPHWPIASPENQPKVAKGFKYPRPKMYRVRVPESKEVIHNGVLFKFTEGPKGRFTCYRQTIRNGIIYRTYGPPPKAIDECEIEGIPCCRLVRRRGRNEKISWFFHGEHETILRGDLARTTLQGKWDDPEAMAVINSALRVMRGKGDALDELIWRDAQKLARITRARAHQKLVRFAKRFDGEFVGNDNPTRAYQIAEVVVAIAKKKDRPPTVTEVLQEFSNQDADGLDGTTFYRALARAGWGWLATGY